jgi:hypothetical protein
MSYKKGTRSVGYYMDEHEEAYFSGITLSIRQKGIEKKLK